METRLGVHVMVNGRGPYRFVVDSGADIRGGHPHRRGTVLATNHSVVLNGMTSRNEVDRVKVDHLTLGQTVTRTWSCPRCGRRTSAAMASSGSMRCSSNG